MAAEENTENAPTTKKTDAVQIVDENGDFSKQMSSIFAQWGLADVGNDYNMVAILGSQSSGKSTLLNLLFGTTFEVLDGTRRRGQTTKGIWCSRAEAEPIMILDVEGTDGRERGDDTNFERKSSLFSLALAPVLLINMFNTDLGRWQGANMSLLRTVLELNLQLFLSNRQDLPSKHLLLFVIRDHAETPVEEVRQIITTDMDKLWHGVTKPAQFESSSISDFFDFEVVCLPHKLLGEPFYAAAREFRQWFHDREHERYVWKEGHYPVDVPSDGFLHYSEQVWDVIRENKDLDIPTQKQLLARFRCDEISNQLLMAFATELSVISYEVDAIAAEPPQTASHGLPGFGERVAAPMKKAVEQFNQAASRYDRDVVNETRLSMLSQMSSAARAVYRSYLMYVVEASKKLFETTLTTRVKEDWDALQENWVDITGQMEKAALESFQAVVDAARPRLDFEGLSISTSSSSSAATLSSSSSSSSEVDDFARDWAVVAEIASLRDSITLRVASARHSVAQRIDETFRREFETHLERPIASALDTQWQEPGQLWGTIRSVFARLVEETLDRYRDKQYRSLGHSKEEGESAIAGMCDSFRKLLVALMKTKSSFAKMRMQKRFTNIFDRDENDLPRRWKPEDDIAQIYKFALQEASELLEALTILRLEPEQDGHVFLAPDSPLEIDPSEVLLSRDECAQIRHEFQSDCETRYYNALRDQEGVKSSSNLPVPLLILIAVLGFNEFMFILSSPLLLITFILCSLAIIVVWKLGLYPVIKPMLKTIVQTTAGSVKPFMDSLVRNIHDATSHAKTE